MNKQALAFLTLFSLILMLSVYYVTLPSDVTSTMSEPKQQEEQNGKKNEDTSKVKTEAKGSEKLQEEIDQKLAQKENEAQAVLADDEQGEEQKQKALAAVEEVKQLRARQQAALEALRKLELDAAVEIQDGTCRITLFDQKEDKELVKKAMNAVYQAIDANYLLEVTFKSA